MRLTQFSVTNFRSITRAERLPLGDFSVLVGPNNEGKSNILEALAIGMQELGRPASRAFRGMSRRRFRVDYERSEELNYVWERDFPQSLQSNAEGRTTLNFDFELTSDEVDDFYKEVGSKFNDTLPISLTFGRSNQASFRVRKRGPSQKQLSKKRKEIAEFVAARVQLQYVPAVRTGGRVSEIVQNMLAQELANASKDPEYAKALEKVQELQQPILDRLSSSIAERLKGFLPDVKEVKIEQEADRVAFSRRVAIVVDDGVPTDLVFKGDGVQSLAALAMMQHYSRETAKALEFILAVEEPEAHLHPRAVHALRDTLRETAETQQVVVTTHSPLFVNRLDLESNIIVTKNKAAPASSVRELRDVLGVQVADNLEQAELVVVVEGKTDETVLRALLPDSCPGLGQVLEDGIVSFLPLRGAGNIGYALNQLSNSLAASHAFLDNDDAGKRAAKAAQEAGLLTVADTTMAMYKGEKKGCELEDLIDPACYAESLSSRFGVNLDSPWVSQMSKGKWSNRMGMVFQASGTDWTPDREKEAKQLVAAAVDAQPGQALKPDADALIIALGKALEQKLEIAKAAA